MSFKWKESIGSTNQIADIHRYDLRGVKAFSHLQYSSIPEGDKKKIAEFSDVLRTQWVSLVRVAKYVCTLNTLSRFLTEAGCSNGLCGADKNDVNMLSARISQSTCYTTHTKRDCVASLKRFYQWLKAPPDECSAWRRRHRYPAEVRMSSRT
jgi:hypothetical protein